MFLKSFSVARLSVLLMGNESCTIPAGVYADMARFIEAFEQDPPDIKALGISGVTVKNITDLLKSIYNE